MKLRPWARPGVLASACLLLGWSAHAQTVALQEGLAAAWARQPERQAAPLRREAATQALDAARRWTLDAPALEVKATTDRATRNDGAREVEATVAVPLWLPGERARAMAAAASQAEALDARLASARLQLAGDVRERYWALQRARVDIDVANQRLASAQALAADVGRRVAAGDLARADGHQAEGALAAARGALAEARTAGAQAGRAWTALTGLPAPVREPATGAETRPEETPAPPHPLLRDLAARAEQAGRLRDLAAVQTRANPELTVGAVRDRGGYGERYGQSLVVGLRVPLGRSHASDAKLATAAADLRETQGTLALQAEQLRAGAAAARDRLDGLDQVLASAERRSTLARETLGFFERSFRLGETDLPTRLRIELEAYEAERQAARARLDVAAAVSSLRQALGLLPD